MNRTCCISIALLGCALSSHAQWVTQKFDLKPGWNGVFMNVDASHDTLNASVTGDGTNPILEVWKWNPPSVAQITSNPSQPTAIPDWTSWVRTDSNSALQRLVGDSAYLVRVATNLSAVGPITAAVTGYTWSVKGKPVAPRRDWTISGLNFIGFSTVTNTPPKFNTFLAQSVDLQSATPEIYYYPGGDLGSNNPALLPSLLFPITNVKRGQAFWMRSGTVFNRYFGPFEVVNSGLSGVEFWDDGESAVLRLKNLSSSNLTITLRLLTSETPPPGQTNIFGVPPLLVRGELSLTNLAYGYTNLTTSNTKSWTLAGRDLPGSETEVVLGLNRSAITNTAGSLLAGVLSFTDSLAYTMVQLPVSAIAGSRDGLWVGAAEVDEVAHYLKSYARNPDGTPVATTNGNYLVTDIDTSLGAVAQPYPLRLIVHNPGTGMGTTARLLQRVYVGYDTNTNTVVTTGESALSPAYLASARRITATHLPWTASNVTWALGGKLGQQSNFTAQVVEVYDDQAANPFLHTYHPDHDNLNATFDAVLAQGSESYRIERSITLNVHPPDNDFSSLIAAGDKLEGDYLETLTLKGLARAGGTNETRQFSVMGTFELNRITDIPFLTVAP